ncbi:TetR/AcrR family transcriptional regulator [Pseudovibrio exalbescens]|uniref:TetR/AcrR family transcriptional regulator n=1 Tax=Pseudovibrio exalbescens TaxID=197461 RepID=UPI0023669524|nr:TetR/AcrR family transcriptional regulator [Pseudovibrio exalbescens]MDD7909270.1 TetR/AcrR family transcriptional regulator [Pseudovibrio exalbescens]
MTDADTPTLTKRAEIIIAARGEFQERGFESASMDRISQRAGVSKRTVYKHFTSKENLFHAIVEELANRLGEALDVAYTSEKPIEQQLRDLAWAEATLFMSDDFMRTTRMVLGEIMRDTKMSHEVQCRLDKTDVIEKFMRDAKEDSVLDIADTLAATREFIGLLKATGFWPAIYGGELVTEDAMRNTVDSAVAMMLARYKPSA